MNEPTAEIWLSVVPLPWWASADWSAAGSNIWLWVKVSVSVPLALLVTVKAAVRIVPVLRAGGWPGLG